MLSEVFSTFDLPGAQQFDAWCAWFDTVFDVVADNAREGFAARSETWSFGSFALSQVEAPRLQASRTASLIRRNPIDHWNIAIGHERTLGEAAKGQSLDVPAGAPFIVSLGRELVSSRSEDRRLQLYLPRDGFHDLAPVLDGAQGRALEGPMGAILADFLVLLARNAATFPPESLPGIQNALRAMILACVAPSSDHSAAAADPIAATRRETVRRVIDRNLRNGELGPDMLCREVGMSRSQLYRLMESEGGVAFYIQRRRLKMSYAELANSESRGSIATIADGFCFHDASSFSRSFKREFGITPSEAREAVLAGAPAQASTDRMADEEAHALRHLLARVS